jgi:hypothetical protein
LYALGRLGTRNPSYASATLTVDSQTVEAWTEILMRHLSSGGSYLEWALREFSRKTGDRLTEIKPELRKSVVELFKSDTERKLLLNRFNRFVSLRRPIMPSIAVNLCRRVLSG